MAKKIQSRESDGRFALQLNSNAACQRALREEAKWEARREQLKVENAEWAAQHGIDVDELDMLFA